MVFELVKQIGVTLIVVILNIAYLTYIERKVLARMQQRIGPNRVGPYGLLQPIADVMKLLIKEDIIPTKADKIVFIVSPILALVPAFVVYATVPFTNKIFIADLNIGILYVFAISSLSVYGIVMSGWASNSKYALLGGLRSAAQMISYEVYLGFSVIGVIMLSGSMSMIDIVNAQKGMWFIFLQPLGFFIFLVAGIAETNRIPFDLPEAENELVAGFHTEYSGMRFAFFFLAEYSHMFIVSAMATILFFGGWSGPYSDTSTFFSLLWFLLKTFSFIFLFLWIRGTLPRYRYDQLMDLGWKFFLPLSLLNILITGLGTILK